MAKYMYYGETFGGQEGICIGDYVFCCPPLDAIKRYCEDEIHYCDMEDYEWYLEDKLIYKGANTK